MAAAVDVVPAVGACVAAVDVVVVVVVDVVVGDFNIISFSRNLNDFGRSVEE